MSTGVMAKARAPGAEALAHQRTHTNIFSGERAPRTIVKTRTWWWRTRTCWRRGPRMLANMNMFTTRSQNMNIFINEDIFINQCLYII